MSYKEKEFLITKPTKAYQFLKEALGLSMAEAQKYINKGRVIYQNKVLQNNEKNKILEKSVSVLQFSTECKGLKPLFVNEDFAIFNKPPKMLIHPKGRFTHHSLIDEIKATLGERATLVHRIDKETSGLVLVARDYKRASELGELFMQGLVFKKYLALVKGVMEFGEFCFSLPLATQKKGCDLSVRSLYLGQKEGIELNFKEAKTHFKVLQTHKNTTLLEVFPISGRTHQIRVHLFALGFPILGDPLYGCEDDKSRLYLDREFIQEGYEPLSDEERERYFGAFRLMLQAQELGFCYKGKDYIFKLEQEF
ncbi:RluA family pseudouridine synthase [Helicobacter burdigaliensis]|uniref:RluA family pseudouridine synthase n=1 Tax=Helicobacter burdigaliensis TaxID=2315334 RepID=UPI000EF6FABF|nr:RluA family pseudouridine synthase [Helicobacter burdigaliensis]